MFDGKKRAGKYDELSWVKEKRYIDKIIAICNLRPNEVVCDVGTGTGIVAYEVAKKCKTLVAIDNSDEMLKIAKKYRQRHNIIYKNCNIENPLAYLGKYDCIVARMVFHHINDICRAARVCYKLLNPGGRLVIAEGIPAEGTSQWYTIMFKYKEERRTILPDNMVELYEAVGFKNIYFSYHKSYDVSLKNWLDSANISKDNYSAIYDMHLNAPPYIKKAYNIKRKGDDILMTWRSLIIKGTK